MNPTSMPLRASPPRVLSTERLNLRPWTAEDAALLHPALEASRNELQRFTPWVLDDATTVPELETKLHRFADRFTANTEWRYGIFEKREPDVPIGECGLFPRVGAGRLEVGYWLATPVTKRGYATEAAAALTEIALSLAGITVVEMHVEPANVASMRVPERLGYVARADRLMAPARSGRPASEVVVWERLATDVVRHP